MYLPSVYLDDYDMSNYRYDELDTVLEKKKDRMMNEWIISK